jgi:hypothetical protein
MKGDIKMLKRKSLIAIAVIILFLGVSLSPVTAKVSLKNKIEFGLIGENGKISKQVFQLSVDKLRQVEDLLAQLTENMESATDFNQLIEIVSSYKREWSRFPFLTLLLELIQNFLKSTHNLNQLRPLRRDAFIMSWGFGAKLNPFKENKFRLLVPIKLWYYTGRGSFFINSRTLIVDLCPFNIKSLTGRQVGCMRNFVGIYFYRHNTLTDNTFTFMLGRSGTVRGFDLSPFNVWNQ